MFNSRDSISLLLTVVTPSLCCWGAGSDVIGPWNFMTSYPTPAHTDLKLSAFWEKINIKNIPSTTGMFSKCHFEPGSSPVVFFAVSLT